MISDTSSQSRFGYWEHRKGGRYEIIGFGVQERDLVPVVIYMKLGSDSSNSLITRPCVEFFDGRFTKCLESN